MVGDVYSKAEGCWLPSFSASQSQLVQSSKRMWVKVPFEHVFSNLEPTTVYSIHVRAYSAEGASQDSASIHTSTMGSSERQLLQPCRATGLGQTAANQLISFPLQPLLPSVSPPKRSVSPLCRPRGSCHSNWGLSKASNSHCELPAAHFEGPLLLASTEFLSLHRSG